MTESTTETRQVSQAQLDKEAAVKAKIEAKAAKLAAAAEAKAKREADAAEKKAAALPAKLTVPMIVFFLPVLFLIIAGPAAIQVSGMLK